MKKPRHNAIIAIIENQEISTQEELLDALLAQGFKATQATVSRDIKDLKLVKSHVASGQYRYTCAKRETDGETDKYVPILTHSVVRAETAGNITVVKCYPGMAQATCAAIDALFTDRGVVGTLAGDDTIFVLCRNDERATVFKNEIEDIVTS